MSNNKRTINGKQRSYGWKKSPTPATDHHIFNITLHNKTVSEVDLRPFCPPVYDQGELGSCTANAISAAYEIDEIKEKEKSVFQPSRLFIYYNERDMEGTVSEDAGAMIHDGIKVVNTIGVCPETDWPYDTAQFAVKPPANCYQEAQNHKSKEYRPIQQNLAQLKQCLINGLPFVFGAQIYESFESDSTMETGMVPLPAPTEQCLGGHALCCVGASDSKQCFLVRNSWGSSVYPEHGYFYLPYKYMCDPNLASDFWVIASTIDK